MSKKKTPQPPIYLPLDCKCKPGSINFVPMPKEPPESFMESLGAVCAIIAIIWALWTVGSWAFGRDKDYTYFKCKPSPASWETFYNCQKE